MLIRTSVAQEPTPGVLTTATTDTSVATTMEDLAVTTAAILVGSGNTELSAIYLFAYLGVQAFSNYGFIYSHTSYTGDSSAPYENGLRKKWHIRVQQGYRVKITFLGFELEAEWDSPGPRFTLSTYALLCHKYTAYDK